MPRLSYANVTATLALFVAVGGSAYAATALPVNSVGTAQLKNRAVTNPKLANGAVTGLKVKPGSLTGRQVRALTLGTVPSATNALKLGGVSASAYAHAGSEAWHDATLNDGSFWGHASLHSKCYWTNYGGSQNPTGYFRDASGIVHLRGLVVAHDGTSSTCGGETGGGDDWIILSLPVGYQPDHEWAEAAISNDKPGRVNVVANNPGDFLPGPSVDIEPDFPAFTDALHWVSLDGITFRCAPSGQNGCP